MIGTTSPSVQRLYSLATVCRLWGVSRATLYRQRSARVANEAQPPGGAARGASAAMPTCWCDPGGDRELTLHR